MITTAAHAYDDAMAFIESLYYQGMKLGLDTTRRMLDAVGNPHQAYHSVHVAGTNGKGSTAAMIESALRHAEVATGLYTSPHLLTVRERIQVRGSLIDETAFAQLTFQVRECTATLFGTADRPRPTFFEFITTMALLHFRNEGVDIAVVEVGLGGRLDATNVISPAVAVITNVDLDHTNCLGSNLTEIAGEKAAIIKKKIPVICGDNKPEVVRVVEHTASRNAAPLYLIGREFDSCSAITAHADNGFTQRNTVRWKDDIIPINTTLAGRHQCRNLATAFAAIAVLRDDHKSLSLEALLRGLAATTWPGRMQHLRDRWVIDIAHNPAAVEELVHGLHSLFPDTSWSVVFAAMRDKNWQNMIAQLVPLARKLYLVSMDCRRAESADRMLAFVADRWPGMDALVCADAASALALLDPAVHTVFAGSAYLAGDVLMLFNERQSL